MSEVPRLRELAEQVEPFTPDIDIATAMIATVDPKTLDQARAIAYKDAGLGILMRPKITLEAESAEAEFDRVLSGPNTDESKKQARQRLERLLAEELGARKMEHEDQIDLSLAHAIGRKRNYLAKPLRRAAILASAVAISPAAVVGGVVSSVAITNSETKNHPAKTQSIEFSNVDKIIAGIFTSGFIAVGGFMGYIATDGRKLDRAYARRRAIHMLEKSQRY